VPAVPVTVRGYVPIAAVPELRVRVVEQVGVQEVGENEAVAPEGRPEAESETD
jgi:hypothetical protein